MTEFEELDQKYGDMSRVITFRLNPNDGIERKALAYLQKRQSQGDKPRQIIAEALAGAADRDDRLEQVLMLQRKILSKIEDGVALSPKDVQSLSEQTEIPDKLAEGLMKMRKPKKFRGQP